MTSPKIACVILAAGQGARMKSKTTKVLHAIGGKPMIGHVVDAARALSPQRIVVVIGEHAPEVGAVARDIDPEIAVALQAPPKGTAHAVDQAMPALENFSGAVLVLYADTPLVSVEILHALAAEVAAGAGAAVLGFRPADPGAYGRLKLDENGALSGIVEAKDAKPEELEIELCNSGVMAIASPVLKTLLPQIDNKNAKGEFYLTDIVSLARQSGERCTVIEADEDDVLGVNSRSELAIAEEIFQDRKRLEAMDAGVTLLDPSTVYFSYDTKIAEDVVIGQNVVFAPGVTIESGAEIKAFSHLEGAHVGPGASVGPFARLRPGAKIGTEAKVGNFVEIKKADLGPGAKVSHLTYLGDAEIGAEANIGAGTITCNYDGYKKHKTTIADGAFIGSNSALVAPVTIGPGAYVGSGSVITKDVDAGALAVSRAKQSQIDRWAEKFRARHKKKG